MKYENIVQGRFVKRLNRFTASVIVEEERHIVHVKNTGRLGELLVPGATVFLEDHAEDMGDRKLRYSLVTVDRAGRLVNIDSLAPNAAVGEALAAGDISLPAFKSLIKVVPEQTFRDSRFDFFIEDVNGHKGFIEVKGVTLEENGIAKFPDAPTLRGEKHIRELTKARKTGYFAAVIFVIQMKGPHLFMPNYDTHANFAEALIKAEKAGVRIYCYDCDVTPDSMTLRDQIPYELRNL